MHGKRGSMVVCFDDLPLGISCKDLKELVQRAVDRAREEAARGAAEPASAGFYIDHRAHPGPNAMDWSPTGADGSSRHWTFRHFRQQAAAMRWRSNVSDCAILRITDRATGTTRYRGLISVTPAGCALAALTVLNGSRWHGSPLHARYLRPQANAAESPTAMACSLDLVTCTPAPTPADTTTEAPSSVPGRLGTAFAH